MTKKIILSLTLSLFSVNSYALEILVPAYFYPSLTSSWNEMTSALQKVNITAIMNPNNGPNKDGIANADYQSVILNFHKSPNTGQVIGYVFTDYGNRKLEDVIDDITTYATLYDLDGIFLDEMSTDPNNLLFYHQITDFIRQAKPDWKIIGNPGTSTIYEYAQLVDTMVTYENDYMKNQSPAKLANPEKEGRLFYNVQASEVPALLNQAITDHLGYVYFTDDNGANPWDTLPSYWDQEVNAIASIPEPMISLLFLTGLPYFFARVRKQL